jgi:two-component system response regulator FixJ
VSTGQGNGGVISGVVHLVEMEPGLRRQVQAALEAAGLRAVVHESVERFLTTVGLTSPQATLVGEVRPGSSPGGTEWFERVAATAPRVAMIGVQAHPDTRATARAFKAGVRDVLDRVGVERELAGLVSTLLECEGAAADERRRQIDALARVSRLTPREREVFVLVVNGLANKGVAAELDLSEKTVEIHRANVMRKMMAGSLAELVRLAVLAEAAEPSLCYRPGNAGPIGGVARERRGQRRNAELHNGTPERQAPGPRTTPSPKRTATP